MTKLTKNHLKKMTKLWTFGGYLAHPNRSEKLDGFIVDECNKLGIDKYRLYSWAIHKLGRWFGDLIESDMPDSELKMLVRREMEYCFFDPSAKREFSCPIDEYPEELKSM